MRTRTRFAIVGAGWRAQFFIRIAKALPEHFEVSCVLVRSDKAAQELGRLGVPAVRALQPLLDTAPDFVIAAVSWSSMPVVVEELVQHDVKVLAETPPAPTELGLNDLWSKVGSANLVQVAEQYMLMPGHAARLEVVKQGIIGVPTSVQVSSTHLYHAVSMIRTFLNVGYDAAIVNARSFEAPMVDPLQPSGWLSGEEEVPLETTLATLDFGDGRYGMYDFVQNQWWNPLLSRRILVRGTRGELVGNSVTYLGRDGVISSEISYRRTGIDLNLEGNDVVTASFEGRVVYRNPWVGSRLSEDDIAVASLLERTGQWATGRGPAPYPLAQACQDHLLALAIEQSARENRDVRVDPGIWAR